MLTSRRCFPALVLMLLLAGCSARSSRIYAHDEALAEGLREARGSLTEVSTSAGAAIETMVENLEKGAELRRAAITRNAAAELQGDLNALATMTWSDLNSQGSVAVGELEGMVKGAKQAITRVTEQIAQLQHVATVDPEQSLGAAPQAESNELKNALQTLGEALGAKSVSDYLDASAKFIEMVDKKVFPALEAFAADQQLDEVLDVLRKARNPKLIAAVNAAAAGAEDPSSVKLPGGLPNAIKKYLGREVTTVGDLRKLLAAKDSSIAEVRLTLLREGRRTMAELRAAQMAELKERLRLYNARLFIIERQLVAARKVVAQAPPQNVPAGDGILTTLDAQYGDYRARLAGGSTTVPARPVDARAQFTDAIGVLRNYADLNGSLDRLRRIAEDEIQTLEHRALLEQGRIGTDAYRRLASLGLDGMVNFAEGGVTEAQVANWLRALQAVGIGVIGGKVD